MARVFILGDDGILRHPDFSLVTRKEFADLLLPALEKIGMDAFDTMFPPKFSVHTEKLPDVRTDEGRRELMERQTKVWGGNDRPWLEYNKGREYKPAKGISSEALRHTDWLLYEKTGLTCGSDRLWPSWKSGLVDMYQESGGDFDVMGKAITDIWHDLQPGSPHGFVKTVRAHKARENKPENAPVEGTPEEINEQARNSLFGSEW